MVSDLCMCVYIYIYISIYTIMSIGLGGAEAPSFVLRTAMEGTRSSVFGFAFG